MRHRFGTIGILTLATAIGATLTVAAVRIYTSSATTVTTTTLPAGPTTTLTSEGAAPSEDQALSSFVAWAQRDGQPQPTASACSVEQLGTGTLMASCYGRLADGSVLVATADAVSGELSWVDATPPKDIDLAGVTQRWEVDGGDVCVTYVRLREAIVTMTAQSPDLEPLFIDMAGAYLIGVMEDTIGARVAPEAEVYLLDRMRECVT